MDQKLLPYSWGDVADILSVSRDTVSWPTQLVKAEIYWDQITFYVDDLASRSDIIDRLETLFPFRIGSDKIILDGPVFSKQLPFSFELYDEEFAGTPPLALPTQYVAATTKIWFRRTPVSPNDRTPQLPTFAFHSVKGGVGRTTSAISFALTLANKYGQRPLVVDADFEAPGISYLFHGDGREVHFSLEDLLVLAHADGEKDAAATVQFAAQKLANQKQDGLTILPCFRNSEMLSAFAIRPEQLQKSQPDKPFFLLEVLRNVAKAADCTALVIDLRAGFTDLAAMILCGPSVSQIFVTTPSGQSVASTRQMLSFIGSQVSHASTDSNYPAIIINNVISQVRRSVEFAEVVRTLEDSATDFVAEGSDDTTTTDIINLSDSEVQGAPVIVLDHAPALTAAPSRLSFFIQDLRSQACFDQLSTGISDWTVQNLEAFDFNSGANDPLPGLLTGTPPEASLRQRREKLHTFARNRIYADTEAAPLDQFLLVRSLRELATRFRTELPNATCIGMKGAGKTFTFRVLCQQGDWAAFLKGAHTGAGSNAADGALMLPVLPARSLQRHAFVHDIRLRIASELGGGAPIAFSRLNSLIDEASLRNSTESEWGEFWLDVIGWSCGIDLEVRGAGRKLVANLVASGSKLVCVFDGLEETFQAFRTDLHQQAAIRGLTTSLSQILLELPGRPMGQINFVRSDLIGAAYPNNSRQFADRNRAFALTWYEQDILELAEWLADKAGVLQAPRLDGQSAPHLSLEARLHLLWGSKLGRADHRSKDGRTREPRSAEWVVAALSDLKGRLTARDLVGFIAESAETSISDQSQVYDDRLLVPRAMMGAIKPVGVEKIRAMAEENPGLDPVINALRKAPQYSVPITLSEFKEKVAGIDESSLTMLQENGIILIEGNSVEMPEIFRTGLGNVVRAKGGRRSIIGLMNKARQNRALDPAM